MTPARTLAGILALALVVTTIGVAFPPTVPDDYANGSTSYVEEPVEVEGGEIGPNQTELWGWTQQAMGRDVNATPTVVIREFGSDSVVGGSTPTTAATAFQRLLVLDDPEEPPSGGVLAFVTALSPNVNVNADRLPQVRDETAGRTVEGLLVHEFAHVVQFRTPAFVENQFAPLSATSDETRAYRAMAEGSAEFVADDYTDDSAIDRLRSYWNDPETSAAARLGQWPYYRGLIYLDARLDEPSDLWSVYRDRPQTTAAILRGEAPGDGPGGLPRDRSLSIDREGYDTVVRDRPGAALAEVALTKEIDPRRARTVAAGWQWGSLRSMAAEANVSTGERSLRHIWVTEWRNESAVDAFESAMTEYLDGRWTSANGTWHAHGGPSFALERVGGDSLALLVGPDAFLAETTVTVEDDEYAIETSEAEPNASATEAVDASASPTGASVGT